MRVPFPTPRSKTGWTGSLPGTKNTGSACGPSSAKPPGNSSASAGFGLWAVAEKADGGLIGQCGVTMQDCCGREVPEIGYLFRRDCWHKGYATEAAIACREYAFHTLGAGEVCSIIRDINLASQGVAKRNGMVPQDTWVKHYRGVDMPHIRYVVKNSR